MSTVEEWNEAAAEEIPTATLDDVLVKMQNKWKEVEVKKEIYKAELAQYEQMECNMLDLLKRACKTKWQVDGLGTISIRTKYSIRTPKTPEDKKSLFDWIKATHGPESLMGLVSINSMTLNSFVNEEKEKDPMVKIPGLEAPTARESLAFRKQPVKKVKK